jgi:16S rRNA (guanine(1405)-N(7))-methyltransferase
LHNIVAPYLGTLDYETLTEELLKIEETSPSSEPLRSFCLDVLAEHASTAERIPLLPAFYTHLFAITGQPQVILDLACGLHPLAFPWMGLPTTVNYHAYDILQPRADFINHFFTKVGLAPLAENRDILVDPPTQPADVAFFLRKPIALRNVSPGAIAPFGKACK